MNFANPGDHVTEIDINTRTSKERYRAKYHILTFQNIPKVIIIYLDFEVVIILNHFPVKGGLSPYYSPQNIVDQKPLDYKKYFKIPFGSFVQVNNYNNPTNSNILRKIYGIYLQSLDKIQGGHEIFDLHSQRVITRWNIFEIKIPKAIIKHIEETADHDRLKSLKFKNRAEVVYGNYWISGVKHEDTKKKNKD